MSTIFSRIASGEIPSYEVASDDRFYAFLDINPLRAGHTLVIPRQETDYLFDLDDDTLAAMTLFAKRVAGQIQRASQSPEEAAAKMPASDPTTIACSRVALMVLGLEIPHAHMHLIPIVNEADVDLHRERPQFTPEQFKQIAERIRRA